MNRDSLLAFSKAATEANLVMFGELAICNGRQFRVSCQQVGALELAAGGFESGEGMRAMCAATDAPPLHALIQVGIKKYRVQSITKSIGSVSVVLNLEAIK